MPGVPGAEGGIPIGTGTVAQGPVPTLQQATAPTEHKYVTPYEKMAYDTAQRAQMLQQKGFGRSAFTLEQQASQYQQMHHDMALKMAGQAIGSGSYDSAIPYLKSVGFDAKNITDDPDNPQNILITRDNGQTGSVPRTSAQLIGADPTKAAEVMSMIQWRQGSLGYKGKMADVAQDRVNQQREKVAAQVQMGNQRNETMKAVARIRANASPAEVKSVMAEAANIASRNTELGLDEAEAIAWSQRRLRGAQADPKLKAAINATTHISPYTQNPDEQETLKSARTYINDILKKEPEDTGTQKVKQPKLGPSGDPTQNPGGYLPGDYSKDGKYYLSPVTKKWVPAGSK
jgi:hypothetical protein